MENILDQVKSLLEDKLTFDGSDEELKEHMKEKYDNLYNNYKAIYNMTCEGNMDLVKLKYMLTMLNKINNNEISEYDASVKVGEKLVDEYVKPNLK